MNNVVDAFIGSVNVYTSSAGGMSSDVLTKLAVDKIISVGDRSDPALQAQARAFRDDINRVIYHYIEEARRAERDTICARLDVEGRTDIADMIRSL